METTTGPAPPVVAHPAAEPLPRNNPTGQEFYPVRRIGSRDDVTILLLLFIAIFIPPVSVLCITGCDAQFWLNVILELLTFGIGSFFHAVWVILYYGKGGRLTWGQRKKLARRRRAELLEVEQTPLPLRPPQVRSETYADAPPFSA